eukprot:12916473-Prorocentrum_lima.AAC.1
MAPRSSALLLRTGAATTGMDESLARGLAEALGGEYETMTIDDLLCIREVDYNEALSTFAVDGTRANP